MLYSQLKRIHSVPLCPGTFRDYTNEATGRLNLNIYVEKLTSMCIHFPCSLYSTLFPADLNEVRQRILFGHTGLYNYIFASDAMPYLKYLTYLTYRTYDISHT